MKNFNFKRLLPHIIAVAVFLIVTVIFCKPALESDTILKQGDIAGWQGMSQQSMEYKEQHGHYPLWLTSMFSGMPAFQVAMEGAWSPIGIIDHSFQLWLPKPLNFFFLACIAFYFLCICLRIRPYAGILGALAFAYSSFSPIMVTAGHDTQMLTLAYSPAVLGAVILIFDRKYFAGFTLTALFTALQIAQGHQQITYYLLIVLGAMAIAYSIQFIKTKQNNHLIKSLGLMVFAGILGVAANAIILFTTYDYSKESKRAGQLVMEGSGNKAEEVKDGKTTGLSKEYAFQWSYGKAETMTLMFPGVMGYGTYQTERDGEYHIFPKLGEDANVVKYMTDKMNLPQNAVDQLSGQMNGALYWGKQPFTNGPVYLGAIICFLFIFGMFYLDNKHKWWILAVCTLAILLAWGSNLPGFNYFIFDNVPFYNKFRTPAMTLVIPQLLFPVIAALTLNKLIDNTDTEVWKKFKYGAIATACMFVIAFVFYISADFSKENKQRTTAFNSIYNSPDSNRDAAMAGLNAYRPETDNQLYEGMISNFKGSPDAQKDAKGFVSALRKDRSGLFLSDIFRSLIFVLIAAAFIFFYLKKKINATVLIIGLTLASLIDLLGIGMNYLNAKSFGSKENYESAEFPMSDADRTILADKDPNFRVYNMSGGGDPFQESRTSYYHKSIGGYHPAKLGIYDDLVSYQLNSNLNISVLNMLNAKYVIQKQGDKIVASANREALGNAWFIKGIQFVKGPVEEMKAISNFNPKDTAVVDEKFKNIITAYQPADSASSIKMTSFDNDEIKYQSNSSTPRVVIFSEIYYKDWNAYIDEKPVEHFKANYVLRGLLVPAGNHAIKFKFEPKVFFIGKSISAITSWLLFILLIAFLVWEVRRRKSVNYDLND